MLQKIRDNSQGTAAKIIVGFIICTFALFGIDSIVSLGGGDDAPATVNGVEISELSVAQRVDIQKRRIQAQFGENFDPSFFSDKMLRDAAVQSLIEEKVLAQAATGAGIYFSDLEIDRIILSAPDFQEAGVFSADRFDLILRNAGFTRNTYREMLRSSLTAGQSQSAWQATGFSTGSEASRLVALNSQKRDLAYVEFKLDDAKKGLVVSDEEVADYYEANKSRFMSEEKVAVNYVVLSQSEIAKTLVVDEDETNSRYESMLADARAKTEYRAAHILILGSDKDAKAKAAEALKSLDVDSFDDVAKAYSQDDSSKFSGGDLGFAELGIFEPEFADALRTLKVGDVSGVVETRDGQHIIKLLETRQPEVAALADLKDSINEEIKMERAAALYAERLEILKDEAFSSDRLESVAKSLDLSVQSTGLFGRAGGVGLASNRQFAQAAFNENVVFENANSEVIEIGFGESAVLHLKEYKEPAVRELASVSTQIKTILLNEKAQQKLDENVSAALASAKGGSLTGWTTVSKAARDSEGVPSSVLAEAFGLGLNENEPAYAEVSVAGGKAIVRLDAIHAADSVEVTDQELEQINYRSVRNEFGSYRQFNMDKADIDRG